MQARSIISKLSPTFRLVFADGPFFCDAGPGIIPVYKDYGPFRRWLRWLPKHTEIDDESAIEEIWYQLHLAMEEDDQLGADGEWVALLGFSQGAKMSACLLYDQQIREQAYQKGQDDALMAPRTSWKFGVLLAGRAPIVSLSSYSKGIKGVVGAGEISEGFDNFIEAPGEGDGHVLRIPTIHVHGLQDPGIHLHRRLLQQYCHPGTVQVIEWDGGHRVPIKSVDVDRIVEAVDNLARQTGVIGTGG